MIVSISSATQPTPTPTPVDGVDTGTVTPVPTRAPDTGGSVYLTGSDGSVWDLAGGPVRLMPGVVGFAPPMIEHRWNTSPLLPGAMRAGYGIGVQPLSLPVILQAETSLGWRDLDAALWRALNPEAPCYVTVVSPDAETRVMRAWFSGVGDDLAFDRDPFLMRHQHYDLHFVAEEPYWLGTTETQTFKPATPVQYYAAAGAAYVKALMPSNSTANSTLRNDGDVASWVVASVSGSVANFTVTVDGGNVSYGAVADGQTVWIDYHPARQTVGFSRGDNSETAWLGVTNRDFRPVPPGAEVPIGITLTTPGANASVSVELTPRYRRPW